MAFQQELTTCKPGSHLLEEVAEVPAAQLQEFKVNALVQVIKKVSK